MAFPMPPPALPSGFPEPREALPVESADECSDSDDCDDFHDPDDWDGQPWEVVFPSDSPLLAATYESSDGLFDALKEFCIENRMGLITLRCQKDKAKTRTIKYELVCDKSRYNPRESTAKIRNTTTTKLAANCPFKIIVQSLQTNNYEWSMRIVSPLHRDHGRSKNLTEHYHWRRLTEEQMNLLVDLCLDKTISCRSVHKQLCQKWPKIPIRRTDIYNWRWKVNQTKRQGYGPANDFVRTLSESKKVWIWGLDLIGDEFRFRNAAWGYHKGGKMWQQFSSCLQIDATYSTNCYKMPLVTVVAVFSEKTSMPICYGLLNNEQVASFEWFLKQVSRFQRAGIISPPEVVITDKDDQLRNAIRQVFPNTQLQLCVFHINSNVVLYIKKWWKKANGSLDSDMDDDQDNADAADVQELERGNTKVKDMKNAKKAWSSSQTSIKYSCRLLELALQDEPLKEDLDPFWHIKRSRDIDDPLLQIKRPPMWIPKGRPRNSEPFGNERAIPEQEFAPQGSTRSGVQRSARRNYSQFELGPTLDEEDAADLHDQQLRRKRRKVAVSVTSQAARQQAKRQEDTNKPIERHIALEVEENPKITESSPAKETGKEKVGDSITVATD
ncbi:PKS-NRPS hybrid synthetase [Fusarium oxysporum f. sp. raphani]|uniref:PKS-NRPS hybrid synthetase n=1 Tax=Fusarium oxysporum f. sp. raphani TaxID=96318 RepID=A0A8J5PSZ4_FUSOX|nr:PKS-NRPS hybrid synthetase [Fusarium oxysporum f. sp. raphani]